MEEKQLTESVMTTPASSPDLNPIENVWSAMKTYLRSVVKPKKKEELVQGIVSFWNTLSAESVATTLTMFIASYLMLSWMQVDLPSFSEVLCSFRSFEFEYYHSTFIEEMIMFVLF